MSTEQRSVPSVSASGWRGERPVLGGALLIVAGILMLLATYELTLGLLLIGGWFSVIGFVIGSLVILTGVLAIVAPEHSTPIGVTGIGLSILSIIGALGGLLIGIVIGIVGGALCVAWQPSEAARPRERREEVDTSKSSAGSQSFTWQETATSSTGDVGGSPDADRPTPTSSTGPSSIGEPVSRDDEPTVGGTPSEDTSTDDSGLPWQDDTDTTGSTGTGAGTGRSTGPGTGRGSGEPSNPALGPSDTSSSFGGPDTGSDDATSEDDDDEDDEDSPTFGWEDDQDEEETDK